MSGKSGDYTHIDASRVGHLEPCPCCGSEAVAWRYQENEQTTTVVICCTNGEPIGPQEDLGGITNTGCVLYMPPGEFYRDRIKSAAAYWNDYAKALSRLRRANNWKAHSALRDGVAT